MAGIIRQSWIYVKSGPPNIDAGQGPS